MSNALSNILLIARREYLERVRAKSFIVMTILIPAVMGGLMYGSSALEARAKNTSHIAVASADGTFAQGLKQMLESRPDQGMQVDITDATPASRQQLDTTLQDKNSKLSGYVWVTPPAQPNGVPGLQYKTRTSVDPAFRAALENATNSVLLRERLSQRGLSPQEVAGLTQKVRVNVSEVGNTTAAVTAAYTMFFLMYMVIMLYSMNTARSIIEEKTSRVYEVMLATVKPEQMLAGKILGVGSVGLTQVGIWMAAAYLYSLVQPASMGQYAVVGGAQAMYFIAYFVFAYFLYSSIAASLGAMTNSEQELQQMNMFLVLPLAFCMVMILFVKRAPNSPLSEVVSLIPFCSPLLMNFRLALTQVPAWQVALSFVLMGVTILAILWIAARIYRVGILMYGKKPNVAELMRWLKYS